MRKIKRFLKNRTIIFIVILFIAISNFFIYRLSEEASSTVLSTDKQVTSSTSKNVTSSTHAPILSTKPPIKGNVTYYRLAKDKRYHYEFRYELNASNTNDSQQLFILLNGGGRTCVEYWEFPVGRRILSTLRSFRCLILVICSIRKTFNVDGPIQGNPDVKWIYLSLQKWVNEVYYKKFQQYPRLYIHGVSRGSKLAALLSRVLPIQAQIYTIYPGHRLGLLTPSDHDVDMQNRLALDPVFANWFYFDFCYEKKSKKMNVSDLCPFQNKRNNFQPVGPIYFIHLKKDPFFKESDYTSVIKPMRKNAFQLGGILLNHTQSLQLYILPPTNATPFYMQKSFDRWNTKPYASLLFFRHFSAPKLYKHYNKTRRTCLCLPIDFRYFELYPNITEKWPKKKQEEYKDYVNDIKEIKKAFCEEICGDLMTHHSMSSRDLDKGLHWVNLIDSLRHSLYIEDYLTRPLRIWMYEKSSIITKTKYFSLHEPNWINIAKSYQMYSPEYYLQDYFQHLKASSTFSLHNIIWADNPLLADYFIIPSDLMFYYFYPEPVNMTDSQFKNLRDKLDKDYFASLLRNVRTIFPYWTMAKQADQIGSNHIIAMLGGRNMGLLYNITQNLLKNVIQLVFTGIRQDLMPPNTELPYEHRGMDVVYRHGYDVVIPQFTGLKGNGSIFPNLNITLKKKKRLFFFAGNLDHSTTDESARPVLLSLWEDINKKHTYNMTTKVQGKQFDTMTIIDGHIKPNEYIESIQSTVFSLCPEGFLPWSPRLYEAIQIGAIPIILADNIVLPFERFIAWRSFSAKVNVSNIRKMINYVHRIKNFEKYIERKLQSALPYLHAFQWPYSALGENGQNRHVFLPDEDQDGSVINVFHYISLELRCRRLEQLYGLTSESFSVKSIEAQRQACTNHSSICPCHTVQQSAAFREYL